jgi:predicted amidohydrolase
MPETLKIAAVQMDVKLAELETNFRAMESFFESAVAEKSQLVVFPECSLTGYCFQDLAEAQTVGLSVENRFTKKFESLCHAQQAFAVYGMLESTDDGRLFNSLVMIGPHGITATYRKIHLPYLGVDRFTTPGDGQLTVHDIGVAKIGLNICYDCSFPESARVLALAGADVIVLPTNWPTGARCVSEVIPVARALENHVFFVAVDRVGHERGFDFVGNSRICDPVGTNLAFANHDREEIIYAEIEPKIARQKKVVRVPDEHIIDLFGDRRVDKYGPLVQ